MSDDSFDHFLGASACAWTSAESFKAAAESGDGRSWVSLLALANRLSPSVGVVQRRGSVSRGQRSPVQVCFPPARAQVDEGRVRPWIPKSGWSNVEIRIWCGGETTKTGQEAGRVRLARRARGRRECQGIGRAVFL